MPVATLATSPISPRRTTASLGHDSCRSTTASPAKRSPTEQSPAERSTAERSTAERSTAAVRAARLVARRYSSNRVEQEDLAATALLGLLEYAHRRAIDPQTILAQPNWRILQCRAIDRMRYQQRRREGHRAWAAQYIEPQLETAPLRNQLDLDKAVVRSATRLTRDQRQVLCEVYLAGESLATVARAEGWSHPAVRRRHQGMLQILRTSLGEMSDRRA